MDSTGVCHLSHILQLQTVLVPPHTGTQEEGHMKSQPHIIANHICVHPPAKDYQCILQQLMSLQEVFGQAETYKTKQIKKRDSV